MGIAGSPDIFQEKMSDLMATLEFVQTYLDDLLVITKGSLEDHLEKLSMVLTRLQDAGLKINADKSKFCALETEYLGFIHKEEHQRYIMQTYQKPVESYRLHLIPLALTRAIHFIFKH
jgi:hypothetical protein